MKTFKNTLYICPLCSHAHFHPLVYCTKCSGTLKKVVVDEPYFDWNHDKNVSKKFHKWLESLGYKDAGI